MLETLHTIIAAGSIAVFSAILLGGLMKFAFRRMLKQGLLFCLACCGFLHAMATKPGSEPEPEPVVTNRVEFVLGDCLVRTGGGELVQLVEQGGGAEEPEAMAYPGYKFTGWDRPFDVVTNDLTVTALWENAAPSAAEDWIGDIYVPTNAAGIPEGRIVVDSGTKVTITVTGLPKGLSYDKTTESLVYDETKMADGNYAIVVSAKNANGYRNDRVVSFASEGHSGEKDPFDWGETYCVGKSYRIACDEFTALSAKDSLTVSGLPAGFKLVKGTDGQGWPAYRIEGTPTKAGRFTVTWKETHSQAKVEAKYYMTVDGTPSQYVEVSADALPAGCKVSGSGVYAAGAKATLKATAAKGCVFAGWYQDPAFGTPVECDADYRNPTLTVADISTAHDVYYPRFIELKHDYCGEISIEGWEESGEGVPEGKVLVASESLPTVTVSGLPTGMAYDKTSGEILVSCWDKLKAGDYAFVISAKNAGGYKNDRVVAFQYDAEPTYDAWRKEYAVGQIVSETCSPELEDPIEVVSMSMKGLPAGLKLVQEGEDYFLEGIPTKPGRYAVVCTFKGYAVEGGVLVTLIKTYYMTVQGAPSRYVEVVADGPSGCKVTGSGVYAAGATVKTSATAARGYVFAGWHAEGESEEDAVTTNAFYNAYAEYLGTDGDYRLASQSWLCGKAVCEDETVVDTVPAVLVGRFVEDEDDVLGEDAIGIETDDGDIVDKVWDVFISDERNGPFVDEEGVTSAGIAISADSVSYPRMTVKGSIAGITVKNYGSHVTLSYDPVGKTMPKPGEYTLTFTASNQSKSTATRTLTVRVPNVVDEAGAIYPYYGPEGAFYKGETMSYSVGEAVSLSAVDVFGETPAGMQRTIALSGLPAGVKAVGTDGAVEGVPTKAGCYAVNVTVKYRYEGESAWSVTAATVFFRVEAIDTACVGTFNGGVSDADGNEVGTVSATVSAAGKITSCKIVGPTGKATSITLKTQAFSNEGDYYLIEGTDKDDNAYTFEIYPAAEGEDPSRVTLGGTMSAALGDYGQAEAAQNVWGDKDYKNAGMLPNFPSRGVAPEEWEDGLALLFKPSGAVTVKRGGKSGSARFELSTYSAIGGWTGTMTANVPDGTDEGYCRTFAVSVSRDLEISQTERE